MATPFSIPEGKEGENAAIHPFTLHHIFASGSKRGSTVKEVIQADSGWIQWCMENINEWELANDSYYFFIYRKYPKCKHCDNEIYIDEVSGEWINHSNSSACNKNINSRVHEAF